MAIADNLNDVTGFQSWTKTRLGRAVLTWLVVFVGLMAAAFVYSGLKSREKTAPKGGLYLAALIHPSTLNKFRPVSWKFCAAIIC